MLFQLLLYNTKQNSKIHEGSFFGHDMNNKCIKVALLIQEDNF